MQTHRILASRIDIDGLPVDFDYADVFVVLRDGGDVPEHTDWEMQVRTGQFHAVTSARHDVALTSADGGCVRGAAIVRFSDGHRHLFRGDSELDGFEGGWVPE